MTPRLRIVAVALVLLTLSRHAPADDPAPPSGAAPQAAAQKADKPPRVLVTISKETTYITEPLRKDGYVDYVAALNARYSKGVTPENNAAVLFWKAVGPNDIKPEKRDEFFKALGMNSLPEKDNDYFISFDDYSEARAIAEGKPFDKYDQTRFNAIPQKPWSVDEYPIAAAWLKRNEKALALFIGASKRSRWFEPIVIQENEPPLFSPVIAGYSDISSALRLRSLASVKSGQFERAWDDLSAIHRVARLCGSAPCIEAIGQAASMELYAWDGEQALLRSTGLTAEKAEHLLAEINDLPHFAKANDIIERERFQFLANAVYLARGSTEQASKLIGFNPSGKEGVAFARALSNWDIVLRLGNTWFDKIDKALLEPERKKRIKECRQITSELRVLEKKDEDKVGKALETIANPNEAVPRHFGERLLTMLVPGFEYLPRIEEQAQMRLAVIKLGFAMAAYHADRGSYPAKLVELAPKYVAEIAKDIFIDGELHYKTDGDGYVIYSVGPNGVDDGGKGMDDAKNGESWDDIALAVPGPERRNQIRERPKREPGRVPRR